MCLHGIKKGSMNDTNDTAALPKPSDAKALQSADDLALDALASQGQPTTQSSSSQSQSDTTEELSSDELAETLQHLQNVIERNAMQLNKIAAEIKERRESMMAVFQNDQQLAEAEDQAQTVSQQVKERRSQIQNNPQVISLKNTIGELTQEKKELEETISNHLINYYSLTQSKSFDTSDGDQWEFDIRAKVKPRRS